MSKHILSQKIISFILLASSVLVLVLGYAGDQQKTYLQAEGVPLTALFVEDPDGGSFALTEHGGRGGKPNYIVAYEYDGVSYRSRLMGMDAPNYRVSFGDDRPNGVIAGDPIEIVIDPDHPTIVFAAENIKSNTDRYLSWLIAGMFVLCAGLVWSGILQKGKKKLF